MNIHNNTTVAVAISGGVDSLSTLLRLHEAGVPVMAVHGLFGQEVLHNFLVATGQKHGTFPDPSYTEALERMKAVTAERTIPFHLVDCAHEFLHEVIRPFVESYASGHTPNPCALCNRSIKFGILHNKCRELGASHMATGHYIRLSTYTADPKLQSFYCMPSEQEQPPVLLQGADPGKDQSYFLALVSPETLARSLFPLGGMHKSDVIASLSAKGVERPQPKESQEVCFIPDNRPGNSYREFLPFMAEKLGITLPGPGPACLENGQQLGTHKGLWQYTEGQRKGLGIGWKEPLHVIGKENATNTLRLGPAKAMQTSGVVTGPANIVLAPEFWPQEVLVKTRYREPPKKATVRVLPEGNLHITFLEHEKAVAAGQLAAVYIPYTHNQESTLRLVAGGLIHEVHA